MKGVRSSSEVRKLAKAFLKSIGESENAKGEAFEETAKRFRNMGKDAWAEKMEDFAEAQWYLEGCLPVH